jgi:hypothetical protein
MLNGTTGASITTSCRTICSVTAIETPQRDCRPSQVKLVTSSRAACAPPRILPAPMIVTILHVGNMLWYGMSAFVR